MRLWQSLFKLGLAAAAVVTAYAVPAHFDAITGQTVEAQAMVPARGTQTPPIVTPSDTLTAFLATLPDNTWGDYGAYVLGLNPSALVTANAARYICTSNPCPPVTALNPPQTTDGNFVGNTGFASLMSAWSGAALDTRDEWLIVQGEGHNDGAQNDPYAFDLKAGAWFRIAVPNPASIASAGDTCNVQTGVSWPSPVHTYFGLMWASNQGEFWQSPNGCANRQMFRLDPKTQNSNAYGNWIAGDDPGLFLTFGNNSVYDAGLNKSFTLECQQCDGRSSYGMHVYDPTKPSGSRWSVLGTAQLSSLSRSAALNPNTHQMVSFGGGVSAITGITAVIDIYDLVTGAVNPGCGASTGNSTQCFSSVQGDQTCVARSAPGLQWNQKLQTFVTWCGGKQLYSLDITTSPPTVTALPSGSNTAPTCSFVSSDSGTCTSSTGQTGNGTFGRFQYDAAHDCYIVVNSVTDHVFVFKPAASTITVVNVQPSATGTLPFVAGFGLPKGLTSGPLTLNIPEAQVSVIQTWPDGSIRNGVAIGRRALTSGLASAVTVIAGTSAGTNLTCAGVAALNPSVTVDFLSGVHVITSLSPLLGSPISQANAGPQMIDCDYKATNTIGGLVFFHIRLFKDSRMFVRVSVENGWVDVAGTDRAYSVTTTIGATVVQNAQAITAYNHTRWDVKGWIGGDPQTYAFQTVTDLIASKLVPNYIATSISATALNAMFQTYTPMAQGAWSTDMGGTGAQDQIGLLPRWDASYVASRGDQRAFNSVIANSEALGTYAIVWRGSSDNDLPARPSAYPNYTVLGNGGGGSGNWGAGALNWDQAHHGAVYLAYLLTGEKFHLETMQLQMTLDSFLSQNSNRGSGTARLWTQSQTRGYAWAYRTVGETVSIGPNDLVRTDYLAQLSNMIAHDLGNLNSANWNILGIAYDNELNQTDGQPYPTGYVSAWQHEFVAQALGFVRDLEPFTNMTNFNAVEAYVDKWPVGLLGTGAAGTFCYSQAAAYWVKVSDGVTGAISLTIDPTTGIYPDFGTVFSKSLADADTYISSPCTNFLPYSVDNDPNSFWANLFPAISYAKDHNANGAAAGYARLIGATNWANVIAAVSTQDAPQWGIGPRN